MLKAIFKWSVSQTGDGTSGEGLGDLAQPMSEEDKEWLKEALEQIHQMKQRRRLGAPRRPGTRRPDVDRGGPPRVLLRSHHLEARSVREQRESVHSHHQCEKYHNFLARRDVMHYRRSLNL